MDGLGFEKNCRLRGHARGGFGLPESAPPESQAAGWSEENVEGQLVNMIAAGRRPLRVHWRFLWSFLAPPSADGGLRASGRGQDRHRSAAMPHNELSWENACKKCPKISKYATCVRRGFAALLRKFTTPGSR